MRWITALVVLLPLAAFADQAVTVGGVRGGAVFALERDPAQPSRLLAGTFGAGLFVSTDSGHTWSVSPLPEITAHTVTAIRLASDGTGVVCGDPGGQGASPMFFSSNAGASWRREPFDIPYAQCLSLAAGKDPGTWFAGVLGNVANNPNAGTYQGKVYRSTDSGRSWTPTALALTGQGPAAILQL